MTPSTERVFGCPGSTVEFDRVWLSVTPALDAIRKGTALTIPESAAPGAYIVNGPDWSTSMTIFPRYVQWSTLPTMPVEFTAPLSRWANQIEYQDSSVYDAVTGADFVKSLPEDWHPMLKQRGLGFGDKILDVGTGTGRLRLSLVKSGHTNVYGLDSSADCLKRQAEWQGALGVPIAPGHLVHEDDFKASDHAGTFSAVCMSSALHHIADLPGFLGFVSTLLRPGGHFIASAEPTNLRKFNAVCGHDTKVDLLEVIEGHRLNSATRTNSSMLFAEFWGGDGFNKAAVGQMAAAVGLEVVDWTVWQWLGLLLNNHARNHLPADISPADRARYDEAYRKVMEVDAEIKALMPAFAADNFYSAVIVCRKV